MKKMTLHLAAAFIAAGTLLGAEGKIVVPTRPSVHPATPRIASPTPAKPNNAAPVRWLALSDRPCDSSACRMVRFPWSSVPGS